MPHIAIEGLDEDQQQFIANPGTAVRPITGNSQYGGAAYDGNGQAVYVAYNTSTGNFEAWRTRDGYQMLAYENGSVDFLSTIAVGPFTRARNIAVTRISGVLYALLTGGNAGWGLYGQWVYRDTSPGSDGSGPWVQHGTVDSDPFGQSESWWEDSNWGGEILVLPSGRWVITGVKWNWDGSNQFHDPTIATSDNGGVTWTHRVTMSYGLGVRPDAASNSWARFGSNWYWGHMKNGNVAAYQGYSSDGASWTGWTVSGYPSDNPPAPVPVFSTPGRIYRIQKDRQLQYATAAPHTQPSWTTLFDLETYGMPGSITGRSVPGFYNIGPADSPYLIATEMGLVMGIGQGTRSGWRIGIAMR